jgi:hypothetical protein
MPPRVRSIVTADLTASVSDAPIRSLVDTLTRIMFSLRPERLRQ